MSQEERQHLVESSGIGNGAGQAIRDSTPEWSPSLNSSRRPSWQDQLGGSSIASSSQADHPSAAARWNRLRSGVATTKVMRSAQEDRTRRKRIRRQQEEEAEASQQYNGRVDAEGMEDTAAITSPNKKQSHRANQMAAQRVSDSGAGNRSSGVDSWQPLVHLLAEGHTARKRRLPALHRRASEVMSLVSPTAEASPSAFSTGGLPQRATAEEGQRATSFSPSQGRFDPSASSVPNTALQLSSQNGGQQVVQEPESALGHDKHHLKSGDDPLAYGHDKDLLDSSDSDTDSDSEGEQETLTPSKKDSAAASPPIWKPWVKTIMRPSPLVQGVAKCVIAYYIASLFTYSSHLASAMTHLLPVRDSDAAVPFSNLHMLATVAVYFHPARAFGSMLEADIFAVVALAYALVLSTISMLVAEQLHDWGLPSFSNFLTVFIFIGMGMGFVGWTKLKVAKPTFNTACSLVYVSSFTVMVKEGSTHLGRFETDKIWQVSLVVFAGTLVSNAVCFLLWPQRATTRLIQDMSRSLDAYSTLLKMLTRTFLLEDPANVHLRSSRLKAAIHAHHNAFASLQKNLTEAKYEAAFDSRIRGKVDLYEDMVSCLSRLGQHLNGLRSSCGLQNDILQKSHSQVPEGVAPDDVQQKEGQEPFKHFLQEVGPHMRSLVFSCSQTLHALESGWLTPDGISLNAADQQDQHLFDDLDENLRLALGRFRHEQTVALKRVYTLEPTAGQSDAKSKGMVADTLIDSATHGNEAILVMFFFLFTLEELTQELQGLVKTTRQVQQREMERRQRSWWETLSFSHRHRRRGSSRHRHQTLVARFLSLFSLNMPKTDFPSIDRHGSNRDHGAASQTMSQRISRRLWLLGEKLRERDVKFAIKAGFGCALLASPAFVHSTRPTFSAYQGQWALVSFMVVLSPTVGQSNQMSLHRLIGTIFGACVAVAAYVSFPDDNVILPLLGAIFSIPCFYYIVGQPHLASSGRFVLLTFNLTCLYAYNLRETDVEAEHVGMKRTVAVGAGVIWATVLNHMLWPNEARRELSLGLSDLVYKMAWLYQRIATSHHDKEISSAQSHSCQRQQDEGLAELSNGLDSIESQRLLPASITEEDPLQQMDLFLRLRLLKLEGLLAQTKHEPRLKGPFPTATYSQFLNCCNSILDKLHSMRCVTKRREWSEGIRRDWIAPVSEQRRELVGTVLLFFYLLASTMSLKIPLPPYLPPAEQSRSALLSAVRALPRIQRSAVRGSSEYLLFYAYCLAMKDVIVQLETLGRLAQKTFGVIGVDNVEHFDSLFQ